MKKIIGVCLILLSLWLFFTEFKPFEFFTNILQLGMNIVLIYVGIQLIKD